MHGFYKYISIFGLVVFLASIPSISQAFEISTPDSLIGIEDEAMSVVGLSITGDGDEPIPVKLSVNNGTLAMGTTNGLTFTGEETGDELFFSGSQENINAALATLTYIRTNVGEDTLEISLVEPGEVFFPDNGHLYEYIVVGGGITWANAKTAAEALTPRYGASGYLVTITSADENQYVGDRLEDDGWMGASDADEEGEWKWVTGPEGEEDVAFWSGDENGDAVDGAYENWNDGEPNNNDGAEHCGQVLFGVGESGEWNDLRCSEEKKLPGYIAEFGAPGDMPEVQLFNVDIETIASSTEVAYWRFDEGEGALALDTSGNGHHASISGATYSEVTPPDIEFENPYSLNFDGENDGVTTPLSVDNFAEFTLAGWAYPRSATENVGWFGANNVFEFFFTTDNQVRCWTPEGAVNWTYDPDTFLNNWHHITCLGDGENVILYVDGEQVGISEDTPTDDYGSGDDFTIGIGVQDGGSSGPFDGYIDDVRVYDRALTPAEMASLGTGSEEPENVPIVTTFSPADNATNVALDADLIVTFSSATIATSTGSIAVYESSDDSLFESVTVSDPRISIDGATVTIDLDSTFDEDTEYYVSIPGTAFVDGEGLFYGGTSASTTWSFSAGDFTGASITSVSADANETSATITWATSESASSKVSYGLTSSYGTTTTEINTSPRVPEHEVILSDLLSCTLYHYVVVSTDGASNTATSTDKTFTTTGCTGNATPTTATSTTIHAGNTGTTNVTEDAKTFSVTADAPVDSTIVIQVQAVPNTAVLTALGRPSSAPNEIGATVFDVKAIVNGDTIFDSFDAEVTIDYEYTEEEISGTDESTLWLYHYTGGQWVALNDCVLDTDANTISCTTPSFSIFGLFGSSPEAEASTGSRAIGGTRFGCKDTDASNYEYFSAHKQELCEYDSPEQALRKIVNQYRDLLLQAHEAGIALPQNILTMLGVEGGSLSVRDLEYGMEGEDVRRLQALLIDQGYAIPAGPTNYFGTQTQYALDAYQVANGVAPRGGYFGPITRAQMKAADLTGLWW